MLTSEHYSKTLRTFLLLLRDALALDNEPLEAWVSITLIASQNTLLYLSFWVMLFLFTPSCLTKTDAYTTCGTETTFWRETFLVCRVNTSLVTHSLSLRDLKRHKIVFMHAHRQLQFIEVKLMP